MKKAKLVIWDLDETFWRGTLSEGKVERIPQNIEIVKSLTDRGIINSIVSKNDFDKVEEVLKDWGIYDYFVFPKVSWNPKGEIVKSLLEEIKLRAENVLFVDDNQSNRAEVEYYNKGITCIHPDDLQEMLKSQAFEGKDDKEHSRLKQYHVMEQRSEAETKFSSNEDFLRSSHIKIKISSDCIAQEERIFELIQRTNQLNYTKIRSEKDEVHRLLLDETVETRYIEARDDFGEYGIVGFYALKDNSLLHFLFSCRTIGFGIESFLYARLGYPELKVEGDVATPISKESKVDWIEVIEDATEQKMSSEIKKTQRILMVAGCDLEQACAYLESKYNIDKEFATVVDGHEIRTSDLCSLVNTITLDSETQKELCEHLPFMANGITFSSKIYKGDYDIVILSVVDDYIRGMYKRKDDTYYVGFGGVHDQEEMLKLYPAEEWDYLKVHFDYVGYEPENVFRDNLCFILNHIPKTTKILIINGTDVDVSSWIGKERIERNQRMNQVVDEVISAYSNAKLVDMRKIVSSVDDLTGRDNRHFNRSVYYKMAKVIADLCDNSFDITPPIIVNARYLIRKITQKLKNLAEKIKRW